MSKICYEDLLHKLGTLRAVAEHLGIHHTTVIKRLKLELKNQADKDYKTVLESVSRKLQKQQDINRVERKGFREITRVSNALEEIDKELVKILKGMEIKFRKSKKLRKSKVYGIIQLSDIHFNEQVNLKCNQYNWNIASARIKKHFDDSMRYFKAMGVSDVTVVMTGDMFNSDRRKDEMLTNAGNRAKALTLGVEILTKAFEDLNYNGFNVSTTFVTGNESRIGENIHTVEILANDNFDVMLYDVLKLLCGKYVKFGAPEDSLETVLKVGKVNILLLHGHMSISKDITKSVHNIIARKALEGVRIDYVMFGHIHQAQVSDLYSRSGSTVGNNSYNYKKLNISGRPSQNCYIIRDGMVSGIVNPLNITDKEYKGYKFREDLKAYNTKSAKKLKNGKVIFSLVV